MTRRLFYAVYEYSLVKNNNNIVYGEQRGGSRLCRGWLELSSLGARLSPYVSVLGELLYDCCCAVDLLGGGGRGMVSAAGGVRSFQRKTHTHAHDAFEPAHLKNAGKIIFRSSGISKKINTKYFVFVVVADRQKGRERRCGEYYFSAVYSYYAALLLHTYSQPSIRCIPRLPSQMMP